MLHGYNTLPAHAGLTNPHFLHSSQVLHETAAHKHGRGAPLDYPIRGTKQNGILDQIMKDSLETLN
jgi:hypothetical protein